MTHFPNAHNTLALLFMVVLFRLDARRFGAALDWGAMQFESRAAKGVYAFSLPRMHD
jgi:hypothetical protein